MNIPRPDDVNPRPSTSKSISISLTFGSLDSLPSTFPETPLYASEKSNFPIIRSLTGPLTSAFLTLMTELILRSDGAK